jgi:streptomycin 6-kinase
MLLPSRGRATQPEGGPSRIGLDNPGGVDQLILDAYLRRWNLQVDGEPVVTRSSYLLPVVRQGVPAMLKVAVEDEERFGGVLMEWWDGVGAARVLAQDDHALLLERAPCRRSLVDLSCNGRDDEASRIICKVVTKLHAPRAKASPELIALEDWFGDLYATATTHGGVLSSAAATARELLISQQEVVVLHGDIHHGNILDFGPRGWLAIDPKRLIGERGFDYANLFCNPSHEIANSPQRFPRRLEVVSQAAALESRRLLQWILAWCGLSAAWFIADHQSPDTPLAVARMAAANLQKMHRSDAT